MTRPIARGEAGSTVVEVTIVAPIVLILIGFITLVGRIGSLSENVQTAAADAARAASLHRTDAGASEAARATADASLADAHVACQSRSVLVESGRLAPGGSVAVTVTCDVALADLAGFRIPGGKAVSARRVEIVDRYAPGQP